MAVHWLPAIYGYREHVDDGGLISYDVDLGWCFRRVAIVSQNQCDTVGELPGMSIDMAREVCQAPARYA